MKCRTPEGRADLADADVEIAKLAAIQLFSDPEAVRRSMDPGATDEAVKRRRDRLLGDLESGEIYFESTPTREIGLMLAEMPAIVDWLISGRIGTFSKHQATGSSSCPTHRSLTLPHTKVARRGCRIRFLARLVDVHPDRPLHRAADPTVR
jgi:hypothetical protein